MKYYRKDSNSNLGLNSDLIPLAFSYHILETKVHFFDFLKVTIVCKLASSLLDRIETWLLLRPLPYVCSYIEIRLTISNLSFYVNCYFQSNSLKSNTLISEVKEGPQEAVHAFKLTSLFSWSFWAQTQSCDQWHPSSASEVKLLLFKLSLWK